MQSPRVFFAGLVALAALTAMPESPAHNPVKYANVTFVVPCACPQFNSSVSSSFVSVNGQTQLRVVADKDDEAGFAVFDSVPGSNSGAYSGISPPPVGGTFSQGSITFNAPGLQTSGAKVFFNAFFTSGTTEVGGVATINGNTVTIPVTNGTPGAQVDRVNVFVVTANPGPTSTFFFNAFRPNNQPLLGDSTFTDTSESFCEPLPGDEDDDTACFYGNLIDFDHCQF